MPSFHIRALQVTSLLVLLSLCLSACGSVTASPARDPDAVALAALSRQALKAASQVAPDPVLHQVDVVPPGERAIFYYTDPAATFEISVDIPSPDAPSSQWHVSSTSLSKLVGIQAPALDMTALQVGAASVIVALTRTWSGCTPTSVTLYRNGDELEWTGFCRLPDGRLASGTTNNRTREFQAGPEPLSFPPVTATPQ